MFDNKWAWGFCLVLWGVSFWMGLNPAPKKGEDE